MFDLNLRKKYSLSTFYAYTNIPVEVVGIISYEDTAESDFNVKTLALTEKIVNVESIDDYLKEKNFYKCRYLKTGEIIIVWSDIIDFSNTYTIDSVSKYSVKFNISEADILLGNVKSDEEIVNYIILNVKSQFNIDATFDRIDVNSKTYIDTIREQVANYERILNSLHSLTTLAPVLDRLNEGAITSNINEITKKADLILQRLTTISAGL